jgi:sugar fermentation stimulation protein A
VKLFTDIIAARFKSRPNRFVVECLLEGRTIRAYLPNPGRLWELFFTGTTLSLIKFPRSSGRKLAYMVVAVDREGIPVMLHTHYNNLVARKLIEENRVPGLEGAGIVKAEHRLGHSRFDFLLRKDNADLLLEVKSCTLFNKTLAMFPDAVSARATRHLRELAELSRTGRKAAVLFIVHSPKARYFMPEHHTDLEFCRTLLSVRDRVMVKAMGVEWKQDLSLGDSVRNLEIPWDLVERESHDRGSYIIILRLARDRRLPIGGLGEVKFRKGYYLYVGSAMKDLSQRIARHRRLIKKKHWHIDHLREHADFVAAIPIRTSGDLECSLAGELGTIADWLVPGFGSSDCSCATHLFGMDEDPLHRRPFIDRLLHFRMGRLEEELALDR